MKIAIVGGTAGLGFGLGARFAAAGETVVIGSRQAEKAVIAADRLKTMLPEGRSVEGGANEDVVADADVVIVTVPLVGQAGIYKMLRTAMQPTSTVIDCTVPLASEIGGKATRVITLWEGSAAQQAKGILGKDFRLASGFHTIMAAALEDVDTPLDQDILVAGDADARNVAKELIGKIAGARYVDCGSLENARILESLTALIVGINIRYKIEPGAGIRITGIPD